MNILVADDHAIFRAGLRLALEAMADATRVCDAHDVSSLLAQIEASAAIDAIIVDLNMPGMDGYDGLTRLRGKLRQTPILVLSASEHPDDVYHCLAAGASGYVCKSAPAEALYDAVRMVCAGGVYLPRSAMAPPPLPPRSSPAAPERAGPPLTPRQEQVFALVLQGFANKRIAFDLEMSEGTVKAHVAAIMRQFGVTNRVQLLRAADAAGQARPGQAPGAAQTGGVMAAPCPAPSPASPG